MTVDRILPRRTAAHGAGAALVVLFGVFALVAGSAPSVRAQGTTTTTTTTSTTSVAPSSSSVVSTSTTVAQIGEVRELTAQATAGTQVTLRWLAPVVITGLSGYRITVEPTGAITNVPAAQTTVVLTLAPGKYTFAVVAVGSNSTSQPVRVNAFLPGDTTTTAATTTSTVAVAVLAAPQRVAATPSGVGQVSVFWEPPAWAQSNQNGRRVKEYRVTSVPGSSTVVVPAGSLSAIFAGLESGVTYYFSVRAVTEEGAASEAGLSPGVVLSSTSTSAPNSAVPAVPPSIIVPPPPTKPGAVPSPPGVPKPCVAASWNRQYRGTPATFRRGAPQGAFVWYDGRYWQLRVFHPGPDAVIFTGSIQANAPILSTGVQIDPRTDILRKGRTSASFSYRATNDVDGLRISAPCATLLSLRLEINGQSLPIQQIYVGATAANPSGQPVQFVR